MESEPMKLLLQSLGLLILRVSFGAMMIPHGLMKYNQFNKFATAFSDPFGLGPRTSLILAIFAEVVCSGLLIIGLATRLATIPLIVTMIVAHFIVHAKDPWNAKELSAAYLAVYTVLLVAGPGVFSVDNLIGPLWRRKKGAAEPKPAKK